MASWQVPAVARVSPRSVIATQRRPRGWSGSRSGRTCATFAPLGSWSVQASWVEVMPLIHTNLSSANAGFGMACPLCVLLNYATCVAQKSTCATHVRLRLRFLLDQGVDVEPVVHRTITTVDEVRPAPQRGLFDRPARACHELAWEMPALRDTTNVDLLRWRVERLQHRLDELDDLVVVPGVAGGPRMGQPPVHRPVGALPLAGARGELAGHAQVPVARLETGAVARRRGHDIPARDRLGMPVDHEHRANRLDPNVLTSLVGELDDDDRGG